VFRFFPLHGAFFIPLLSFDSCFCTLPPDPLLSHVFRTFAEFLKRLVNSHSGFILRAAKRGQSFPFLPISLTVQSRSLLEADGTTQRFSCLCDLGGIDLVAFSRKGLLDCLTLRAHQSSLIFSVYRVAGPVSFMDQSRLQSLFTPQLFDPRRCPLFPLRSAPFPFDPCSSDHPFPSRFLPALLLLILTFKFHCSCGQQIVYRRVPSTEDHSVRVPF